MINRNFYRISALIIIFTMVFTLCPCARTKNDALSFSPEEQSYIASHKEPIKVGYVQDRVPVSFKNDKGEFAGISRYIFDHLSKTTGLKFDYVPLPAGEVTYDYLLGEGFDLVTSVEYNKENQNARGILISDPYLSSRNVVVAKNNIDFRYDAALSVAISTGSQTIRKVLGASYPNFELIDYDSIADCFDAVNMGKADLMIQNQYVAEYWFSKPKYEKLQVIPVLGLDDQLCFSAVVDFKGMNGPSQEDGRTLIDILNKAIANMTEDEVGTYTIQGIMENQYKLTISDFFYRYRYVAIALSVALIIILVLAALLLRQRIRYAESKADAKAKGEFLSTMSHEIRTPLNGLIGLNYLMSQRLDDKEQLAKYLQQSTTAANYLLSLVNDILDTSKLQAEKLELILRPTELDHVLDTVSSLVGNAMAEKNISFNISSELTYPCVMADETRIQQVLLNLLDNGRKFTPEGGSIDLAIRQELTEDNNVLNTVTVSDTGRGMSEEFQKHIFDVFSQELDTVSKGNQGTGLGLFICRSLALLMGGDLTVSSLKNKGSKFTFTFKAAAAEPTSDTEEEQTAAAKNHPNILVAEDNELNGEILMELLHDEGFDASLAENGKKAVEIFASSKPYTYEIILMDLLMPEMDGFEATKAIRAMDRPDARTVRIFACTANSFSEDRDKALESGMNDFISKPVNITDLIDKLSK